MDKTSEFIDVILENNVHQVDSTVIPFYEENKDNLDLSVIESEVLLRAFEDSYSEFIYWFYTIKPDVNLSVNDEEPFRLSCEGDALELVEFLLEKKPDINKKILNNHGLKKACEFGHKQIVEYLMELSEFSVDDLYEDDNYCFFHSLKNGKLEVAKYIYSNAPLCVNNIDYLDVLLNLIYEQFLDSIIFCLNDLNININDLNKKEILKASFICGNSNILLTIFNSTDNNDFSILMLDENKDLVEQVFYNLNDNIKQFVINNNLSFKHICGKDLVKHYSLYNDTASLDFLYDIIDCDSDIDFIAIFNLAYDNNLINLLEWLNSKYSNKFIENSEIIMETTTIIVNDYFKTWLVENYNDTFKSLIE